ncbi:Cytochrome P450 monooxygenase [Hyphodiscus hymeniophilus]|uniref:Cytochrome P450 monooxygenase n=1 Tax=Hyphodiscus hymeniophilus TaxID=353542 RepID=A0A9P6VGF7_9HELO|nr:Cytochrome P450 monooxygenase [Hyphodiscus hymeniophilus]
MLYSVAAFATAILAWISYLFGLVFYRLYLSPLSKFPGPKFAAASKWYEFYFDVVLRGQFTFQIQRMHRKYGPIVRINPFELHVEDSDYWEELYTGSKEYERYDWMLGRFGANTTTSSTAKSDLHAIRRAPLNPMFSKRSITKFEPVIKEKVELLSKAIAAYREDGRLLILSDAFNAFAGDVIATYCFGFSYNHMESPDFIDNFHPAYEAVRKFAHLALHFPVAYLDLRSKIANIIDDKGVTHNQSRHPTIFSELLESDLPQQEKTVGRLGAEAQQMIGAGLETVAWALTTTVYHIIDKPSILKRLRAELEEAMPDSTVILDSLYLEKLPYLNACVKEGIRLSSGVSVRLPRVSQEKIMKYKDWVIPIGTPVSMTTIDVLYDQHIFPDSRSFVPERWLGNPKTKEGESLNRYFVPFGKGPRACIGINLANVELHLALAIIFRRFTFELYETDSSDIEMAHDFFVPSPKLDSMGLRVKVNAITVP